MRFLIYVAIIVSSEAGLITRDAGHPSFPNLRTVYHGHGATSYQNVQLENHDSVLIPEHHSTHEYVINNEDQYDHEDHVIHSIELLPDHPGHYIISVPTSYIEDVVIHTPHPSVHYHEYDDYEYAFE